MHKTLLMDVGHHYIKLVALFADGGRKARTAGNRTSKEIQEAVMSQLKAARAAGKKVCGQASSFAVRFQWPDMHIIGRCRPHQFWAHPLG